MVCHNLPDNTTNPLCRAISKGTAIFYIEILFNTLVFCFQTPLSRAFLKALKTDVLTDIKGRPLRHTRNMTQVQPQSRGAPQRSSTDATVSRMEHDYQISPHINTRSSFVSDSPSSLFRPGITGTGAIESRTSFFGQRKIRYFTIFFSFFLCFRVTRS